MTDYFIQMLLYVYVKQTLITTIIFFWKSNSPNYTGRCGQTGELFFSAKPSTNANR